MEIPGSGIRPLTERVDYTVPTGAYEGVKLINNIPEGLLRFQDPAVVYVAGSGLNVFGHALFMINRWIGYVHAVEVGVHRVRFLPHHKYTKYLEDTGKVEWGVLKVNLANENGATNYISSCL